MPAAAPSETKRTASTRQTHQRREQPRPLLKRSESVMLLDLTHGTPTPTVFCSRAQTHTVRGQPQSRDHYILETYTRNTRGLMFV